MCNFQNSMCVGLTLLLTVFLTVQSRTLISTTEAQDYLRKCGYLAKGSRFSEALTDKNEWSEALQDFQKLAGLNVTGELDEATMYLMSVRRCGVPDKVEKTNENRFKRYTLLGKSWFEKNLNYKISKYSKHLTKAAVDNEIARAFSVWSKYTDLTFTQTKSGLVHIEIKFVEGEQQLNGRGGFLARASFPPYSSNIYFDDAEEWTVNSYNGTNLFQVAVHEIGHALGLLHSKMNSAAMARFYRGYDSNFHLDQDDIAGIQALYGKKSSNTPHLCEDNKIDTVFTAPNGDTIIFKGDQYYLIKEKVIGNGYPKSIAERWPHIPDNIDAAFTNRSSAKTYFFKDDQVWVYYNNNLISGYPRLISEIFPTVPNNLDAALHYGESYIFFKGEKIWIQYRRAGKLRIYSTMITSLHLPSNLDAVFKDGTGDFYAFKNSDGFKLAEINLQPESSFKIYERFYQCKP